MTLLLLFVVVNYFITLLLYFTTMDEEGRMVLASHAVKPTVSAVILTVCAKGLFCIIKLSDPSQGSQQTAPSSDHFVQPCCSVCRDIYQGPVGAIKCGQFFCKSCVDNIANGVTFLRCSQQWCAYERPQPIGTMSWRTEEQSLLGYDDCSTIAVTYNFSAGNQGA